MSRTIFFREKRSVQADDGKFDCHLYTIFPLDTFHKTVEIWSDPKETLVES